jgi:phage terminase large subunit
MEKPAPGKRAVIVWHRRSGKDSTALNVTAVKSHERTGVYWHMLPEAEQARKAVWNGIDKEGRRIIDQVFPHELRAATDNQTMMIRLKCGSIWQCVGSDNYNSLVGTNPVGIVYSEYSIADPAARDFLRPILRENGGWEMYVYTPRGKNHGYDLYQMAKGNPKWFAQLLTVDDTKILSPADIQEERDSGMDEDLIRQEYFCSFDAAMRGAYYGDLFEAAEKTGRITKVPYDPAVPVETWWDLGIGDSTAIWFVQFVGREIHVIDYHEGGGVGLEEYARLIVNKPYAYSRHVAPHDIVARELGTGKTRLEMMALLGISMIVAPKLPVDDGIQATRQLLARMYFDNDHCSAGIKAASQYRRAWNDKTRMFLDHPHHDWTSHAADALRTGAVADGRRAASGFNAPLKYKGRVGA